MDLLLGFDPGGQDRFGWAIAEFSPRLPLKILAVGLARHAQGAVEKCLKESQVFSSGFIRGIGIDSPIYWTPNCDRKADRIVRMAIDLAGAKSASGTVQHINSLRGACVVQGIVAGILLRSHLPNVPISESHPKALLHLLPQAIIDPDRFDDDKEFDCRDAAISTVSAWAMVMEDAAWSNLLRIEESPILPIPEPLGYWMPIQVPL